MKSHCKQIGRKKYPSKKNRTSDKFSSPAWAKDNVNVKLSIGDIQRFYDICDRYYDLKQRDDNITVNWIDILDKNSVGVLESRIAINNESENFPLQ